MRITVFELPARWREREAALADVDARLGRGAATDLVLLPEASLTGYVSPQGDFDLSALGEPLDGPTARALAGLAAKHGVHLVGPLIEADGARRYNAMVGFAPTGERVMHYRKRHPWIPETWATPGEAPHPVVELCGRRVTIATCYDVHFLPEEAAAELAAADVLLFPSAWVERVDTRRGLLRAIATEFSIAVVNANWAAGVVRVPGQGGSCVVDARGEVIASERDGRVEAEV